MRSSEEQRRPWRTEDRRAHRGRNWRTGKRQTSTGRPRQRHKERTDGTQRGGRTGGEEDRHRRPQQRHKERTVSSPCFRVLLIPFARLSVFATRLPCGLHWQRKSRQSVRANRRRCRSQSRRRRHLASAVHPRFLFPPFAHACAFRPAVRGCARQRVALGRAGSPTAGADQNASNARRKKGKGI